MRHVGKLRNFLLHSIGHSLLSLLWLCSTAYGQDSRVTIEHQGPRYFEIHVPRQAVSDALRPAILVFHGGGGTIAGIREQTQFNPLSDREGFLVVYLAGTSRNGERFLTWNAGNCCGYALRQNVDDVGFVAKVIDELVLHYRVDRNRIYATGHSNGAMMSYRIACELSTKIAAIAPNAGEDPKPSCKAKRLVPILHFHGTDDLCANFSGGTDCGGCFSKFLGPLGSLLPGDSRPCLGARESLSQKARAYGCASQAMRSLTKGKASCYRYTDCQDATDLEFCEFVGAGHTWPGGHYAAQSCANDGNSRACKRYRSIVGEISNDLSASAYMWDFFKGHSLLDVKGQK